MAHELREGKDGVLEMFSVRETPWHRGGHILSEAPSFKEGLQMAGQGYTVKKEPVFVFRKEAGKTPRPVAVPDQYVLTREDTGEILSRKTVGKVYEITQNEEGFSPLIPLLDSGLASLETGGTLRNGADAWLMVKWNIEKMSGRVQEIYTENGLKPFGFMAMNHDGRKGMTVQDTTIRIVCANTLGFAENEKDVRRVIVRHSSKGQQKLTEAAEKMWGDLVKRYDVLSEQYVFLKNTILDVPAFNSRVLDIVAPLPQNDPNFKSKDQGNKQAEATIERAERKRDEVTRLWTAGSGHVGDFSAWEAYNAAVEAIDHDRELWRVNKGGDRLSRLAFGDLHDMKQDVLASLLTVGK